MKSLVDVLGERRAARRRRGEASWFVLVPALLMFVAALAAARSMPAWGALLTVAAAFGALSLVGLLWGADSRDGSDWKPRKPGSIR
jgi:hypothetical protein